MKYAEGFKDLPLDSAELVTDCRIASFHLGSKKFNSVLCCIFLSRISFSNSINQKKNKTGLHFGAAQMAYTSLYGLAKCLWCVVT